MAFTFDTGAAFSSGQATYQKRQAAEQKRQMDQQVFEERKRASQGKRYVKDIALLHQFTNSGDESGMRKAIGRIGKISEQFGEGSVELLQLMDSGNMDAVKSKVGSFYNQQVELGNITPRKTSSNQLKSAGTREFDDLTKDLTPEEKAKAIKIKLGLKGRAISNAISSAIDSGDIDSLVDAKGRIKQVEKFNSMTGASRAKAIDKGLISIEKIDKGLLNINQALVALNNGAGVGVINKHLPSIKAASVELDHIRQKMGLHVVGDVTFGALSKGELDLALNVAIPPGLDAPHLIIHLNDRKAAQEKMRAYFNEQIQFLDTGGTIAGFLRMKERQKGKKQGSGPQFQPQQNQTQQGQQVGGEMSDEDFINSWKGPR